MLGVINETKNWINEKITHITNYKSEIIKLNNDLKLKQLKIQHAEKMVSKLDKHEWDENCDFCMANPWLHETKQVADLLPKLKDEENDIIKSLEYSNTVKEGLELFKPKEKLKSLFNLIISDL